MNEFEVMGYNPEQAKEFIKIKERCGVPTEALLSAIQSFEGAFKSTKNTFSRFSETCSKVFVDENHLYNVHMAKYSKKKRTRKKYARRLIK